MERRTLITTLGSAAAVALAGCLSGGGDDGTPTGPDGGTDTPTPQPTVTDTEFTVIDSQGGTERDSATVTVDSGTVLVEGTIWGRNGCQTAELASASYDDAADELTVAVATIERADAGDGCTQALVEIDYTATVAFENGTPATVVVTHTRGEDTETVTTASP